MRVALFDKKLEKLDRDRSEAERNENSLGYDPIRLTEDYTEDEV